jgi:chromosome segregation ATPase
LSSLFLCGFVLHYVAYNENYKKLSSDYGDKIKKIENDKKDLTKQLQDEITKGQNLLDSKNKEIAVQQAKITEVQDAIRKLESEKSALQAQVEQLNATTSALTTAHKMQQEIAVTASKELTKVQGDLIIEKKKYDEVATALTDKEALINMLQTDAKRLLEEKTSLEKKLGKFMQPYGQKAVPEQPVTSQKDKAQPVQSVQQTSSTTTEIGLKAKITAVDMKNSMAKISIGESDGVKKGMKFHVSRGSDYICDILIIDVAAQEAVGSLELVQQEPKPGDTAATNL